MGIRLYPNLHLGVYILALYTSSPLGHLLPRGVLFVLPSAETLKSGVAGVHRVVAGVHRVVAAVFSLRK